MHTVHPDSFIQDLAQLEEDELAELEHVVYVSELPWVIDSASEQSRVQGHYGQNGALTLEVLQVTSRNWNTPQLWDSSSS